MSPSTRRRPPRTRQILTGLGIMALVVVVIGAVVVSRAGRWGVPGFSFTNEQGSTCRNNLTGFTCDPITLDQVAEVARMRFPADTRIVAGRYRQTHDFFLTTRLEIPASEADAVATSLHKAYGPCLTGHASPLPTSGLKGRCVMSNEDAAGPGKRPDDRIYTVASGVRADGVRIVQIELRSR